MARVRIRLLIRGIGAEYRNDLMPIGFRLTCDQIVTYCPRHGRGVQGARRPDPAELARRALPGGRADVERARGALDMTRFGVMKHLKQLEEAGLVVTRRRGREKLHFLNPVPIRLVHDRWVSKYAEPWAAALSGLKTRLEKTDGEGVRDLHQDDPGAALGGDHRQRHPEQVPRSAPGSTPTGPPARATRWRDRRRPTARSAKARTSRSTRPAGWSRAARCALERRREERGHLAGHLGDRAGGRLVPADRDPRPAPRGRQRRDLRRLADDPLRAEDPAGDRPRCSPRPGR